MTTFDVIYVPFPFTDLSAVKKRPCIVLGTFKPKSFNAHHVVAMITSKLDNLKFPHDLTIEDLKSAGLPSPSVIRISKIVTIDSSIVIKKLGRLAKAEQAGLVKEFRKLFKELT